MTKKKKTTKTAAAAAAVQVDSMDAAAAADNAAAVAVENCINTNFSRQDWQDKIFLAIEKKETTTTSSVHKGYEVQGLVATLLLQGTDETLNTLDNSVNIIPAGTTKEIRVIRDDVAKSDIVPKNCEYKDGQWITEVTLNPRQSFKKSIEKAYVVLIKRSNDKKDGYELPEDFVKFKLLYKGGSESGEWLLKPIVAKLEAIAEPVIASVEPTSMHVIAFRGLLMAYGLNDARKSIELIISNSRDAIIERATIAREKLFVELDRQGAYQKAKFKSMVIDQYKVMLSAGISEDIANLAIEREHGNKITFSLS